MTTQDTSVITPVLPAKRPQRSGLIGCSVTVDAAGGTVTWATDSNNKKKGPVVMPLAGPGALTTLVQAWYVAGDAKGGGTALSRQLFCDASGRCLARGRAYFPGTMDEAWPDELWTPLRAAGVEVVREQFVSTHQLQLAHPGAANRVAALSWQVAALLVAGFFALALLGIYLYTVVTGT